jgi:hypothetical protein
MFLGDELLGDVITGLLTRLKAGDLKPDVVRTYVQAVGHVRWVQGRIRLSCHARQQEHWLTSRHGCHMVTDHALDMNDNSMASVCNVKPGTYDITCCAMLLCIAAALLGIDLAAT